MVMELAHQSWRAMRRPACIYKHLGGTPALRRAGGALGKRLAYLRRAAQRQLATGISGIQRQWAIQASTGHTGTLAQAHYTRGAAGPWM